MQTNGKLPAPVVVTGNSKRHVVQVRILEARYLRAEHLNNEHLCKELNFRGQEVFRGFAVWSPVPVPNPKPGLWPPRTGHLALPRPDRRRRIKIQASLSSGDDLDGCYAGIPGAGECVAGRALIARAVAGQMDPGDPALHRAGRPVALLRRAQRGGDGGDRAPMLRSASPSTTGACTTSATPGGG